MRRRQSASALAFTAAGLADARAWAPVAIVDYGQKPFYVNTLISCV
jgi:hypothetical protein